MKLKVNILEDFTIIFVAIIIFCGVYIYIYIYIWFRGTHDNYKIERSQELLLETNGIHYRICMSLEAFGYELNYFESCDTRQHCEIVI
jgi:hypothetical protein